MQAVQLSSAPAAHAFVGRAFNTPPQSVQSSAASMRLQAVRERDGVVDFIWSSTSAAAATLLHCEPAQLMGKRLREVMTAGPLGHPALIDRYRRVLAHGNAMSFEQVHLIAGRQEIVSHRVVPMRDGVTVWLTNLSAERRAQIAQLQADALQACLERNSP